MATEVIKTIKPSGGDYTSLSAWEAGEQRDLVTADEIAVAECYAMADTTAVVLDGWTTSSTQYIKIYTPPSERHDGKWNTSKYYLRVNSQQVIAIAEQYVVIDGIQAEVTESWVSARSVIHVNSSGASNGQIDINNCILQPGNTNTDGGYGINLPYVFGLTGATVNVSNSIIQGFFDTGGQGIGISEADFSLNVYNSVITNNETGINQSAGTVTITNCAIFNNTTDVTGTMTVTYTASDDTISGTGNIDWDSGSTDWNANFTDYSNGDFSIKDTGADIYNAGTDLSGSGVTDDIIGTARPQSTNYDIGAFELIVGASGPTIVHSMAGR